MELTLPNFIIHESCGSGKQGNGIHNVQQIQGDRFPHSPVYKTQ